MAPIYNSLVAALLHRIILLEISLKIVVVPLAIDYNSLQLE